MPTLEDDVMEPLLDDWDEPDEEDDLMDADSRTRQPLGSFYLSTSLVFPHDTVVHDLTFFGDDGKSALYWDGQVQERRQGLAVLLQRGGSSESSPSSMELWVVPDYDERAQWEGHNFVVTKDDERSATTFLSTPQQTCSVQPGNPDDGDDDDVDSTCLWAKTRVVSDATAARLFVSGSRGVAAVVSEKSGGASHVALWDLQEDEEEDDDEDADMADDDDDDNNKDQ
jgi:hypothetical protein